MDRLRLRRNPPTRGSKRGLWMNGNARTGEAQSPEILLNTIGAAGCIGLRFVLCKNVKSRNKRGLQITSGFAAEITGHKKGEGARAPPPPYKCREAHGCARAALDFRTPCNAWRSIYAMTITPLQRLPITGPPTRSAKPARTLDLTFMVFLLVYYPCPSHVDLANPMLTEFAESTPDGLTIACSKI